MSDYHQRASDTLADLRDVNHRLAELMPRLDQANKELAEAARPLDRLSELDLDQRRKLAGNIRAAELKWEDVTALINEALAQAAQMAGKSPQSPGGNVPPASG